MSPRLASVSPQHTEWQTLRPHNMGHQFDQGPESVFHRHDLPAALCATHDNCCLPLRRHYEGSRLILQIQRKCQKNKI